MDSASRASAAHSNSANAFAQRLKRKAASDHQRSKRSFGGMSQDETIGYGINNAYHNAFQPSDVLPNRNFNHMQRFVSDQHHLNRAYPGAFDAFPAETEQDNHFPELQN